ncbi:ABC transporter permease, partial [Rhizobium sp. AP16]|uniref:ABC transporter permease n=1 Tax=Rhizobium sp. AP16 TaxID=1144306 RepID=UPI00026EE928
MVHRVHPLLIAFAVCVFFFLLAPLVIIIGSAFSDTSYLTFPPQGLTLHWFWNIFEIEAFRTTAITSFELAFLGTGLSLLMGIPAAYAISRYRLGLPSWL